MIARDYSTRESRSLTRFRKLLREVAIELGKKGKVIYLLNTRLVLLILSIKLAIVAPSHRQNWQMANNLNNRSSPSLSRAPKRKQINVLNHIEVAPARRSASLDPTKICPV